MQPVLDRQLRYLLYLDALELGRIDMGFTRPLPRTQAGRFVEQSRTANDNG
jgi:hypothetical protein